MCNIALVSVSVISYIICIILIICLFCCKPSNINYCQFASTYNGLSYIFGAIALFIIGSVAAGYINENDSKNIFYGGKISSLSISKKIIPNKLNNDKIKGGNVITLQPSE